MSKKGASWQEILCPLHAGQPQWRQTFKTSKQRVSHPESSVLCCLQLEILGPWYVPWSSQQNLGEKSKCLDWRKGPICRCEANPGKMHSWDLVIVFVYFLVPSRKHRLSLSPTRLFRARYDHQNPLFSMSITWAQRRHLI